METMEVVEFVQEKENKEGRRVEQDIIGLREHFTEGQLVEIRTSDDLALGDSWFTAKIIELPNMESNKSIFVEYGSGPSDLPKRYINASQIRPIQFQDPPNQFLPNQVVDAFYENGWWKGKIVEVHDDSRYTVCFPDSRSQKNMDFGQESLRVHQDWIGGKWVHPQDEDRDAKCDQVDVRKSDLVEEDKVCDSSIMQVQSCSEILSVQSVPLCIRSDHIPPSEQQQCRRTTKRWRCNEMASPGKIYCDKHQLLRDRYDDKRRKGPKEGSRFKMDLILPCGQRQCRRGGKRWRCHEMAAPGKVYCEKHQLKRDIYNDKRRKGPHKRRHLIMEPLSFSCEEQSESGNCCLVASGGDQRGVNGDHLPNFETVREKEEERIEDIGHKSPSNSCGGEQLNSCGVELGGGRKRSRSKKKLMENNALSSKLVLESGEKKRKESFISDKEELIRLENVAVRRQKLMILKRRTCLQSEELVSGASEEGCTSKGTVKLRDTQPLCSLVLENVSHPQTREF